MLLTILAVLFLLVPVMPVLAYVDPGTGSMVVQAVIAALVAGGAFIGAFWRRIFRRRGDKRRDQTDAEDD